MPRAVQPPELVSWDLVKRAAPPVSPWAAGEQAERGAFPGPRSSYEITPSGETLRDFNTLDAARAAMEDEDAPWHGVLPQHARNAAGLSTMTQAVINRSSVPNLATLAGHPWYTRGSGTGTNLTRPDGSYPPPYPAGVYDNLGAEQSNEAAPPPLVASSQMGTEARQENNNEAALRKWHAGTLATADDVNTEGLAPPPRNSPAPTAPPPVQTYVDPKSTPEYRTALATLKGGIKPGPNGTYSFSPAAPQAAAPATGSRQPAAGQPTFPTGAQRQAYALGGAGAVEAVKEQENFDYATQKIRHDKFNRQQALANGDVRRDMRRLVSENRDPLESTVGTDGLDVPAGGGRIEAPWNRQPEMTPAQAGAQAQKNVRTVNPPAPPPVASMKDLAPDIDAMRGRIANSRGLSAPAPFDPDATPQGTGSMKFNDEIMALRKNVAKADPRGFTPAVRDLRRELGDAAGYDPAYQMGVNLRGNQPTYRTGETADTRAAYRAVQQERGRQRANDYYAQNSPVYARQQQQARGGWQPPQPPPLAAAQQQPQQPQQPAYGPNDYFKGNEAGVAKGRPTSEPPSIAGTPAVAGASKGAPTGTPAAAAGAGGAEAHAEGFGRTLDMGRNALDYSREAVGGAVNAYDRYRDAATASRVPPGDAGAAAMGALAHLGGSPFAAAAGTVGAVPGSSVNRPAPGGRWAAAEAAERLGDGHTAMTAMGHLGGLGGPLAAATSAGAVGVVRDTARRAATSAATADVPRGATGVADAARGAWGVTRRLLPGGGGSATSTAAPAAPRGVGASASPVAPPPVRRPAPMSAEVVGSPRKLPGVKMSANPLYQAADAVWTGVRDAASSVFGSPQPTPPAPARQRPAVPPLGGFRPSAPQVPAKGQVSRNTGFGGSNPLPGPASASSR